MTLYDPDLITIFLAELEVNHPKNLLNSKLLAKFHALSFENTIENTKAKQNVGDLISESKLAVRPFTIG